VSSVFAFNNLDRWLISHAYTEKNPSVQCVRQGLALDEKRTMFRGRVWPEGNDHYPAPKGAKTLPQDAKDVWFPGVHGDVGGGYEETESGLAKVALHWMIEQTRHTGLLYDQKVIDLLVMGTGGGDYIGPDAHGIKHNSMSKLWSILEFIPRRQPALSRKTSIGGWQIPWFEPRFPPEGSRIHQSVFDRITAGEASPHNLPNDYEREPWSNGFDAYD
jgi:hypothetical protein